MSGRRVLVTGGSGFVGRAAMEILRERGHAVRGTTRGAGSGSLIHVPDIGPATNWDDQLVDVDAVVHLAAHVHVTGAPASDSAEFQRVNVDGTRRFAEACLRANVKTFVFMSSIGVVADRSDVPLTEQSSCNPATPYARSKYAAELLLSTVGGGMRMVILRPPLVYGRGAPGNFGALVRAVRRRLPMPFASVRNHRSLVYIGNLVDAVRIAIEDGRAAGTYHVSDQQDLSTATLIREIAGGLDVDARIFPVPVGVLRAGGRFLGQGALMSKLVDSLRIDASRFSRDTGWVPPIAPNRGIRASVMNMSHA